MNIQNLANNSEGNNHYLKLVGTNNSNAVAMQSKFIRPVTVLLSSITATKTASIEYALGLSSDVKDGSAIWHNVVGATGLANGGGTSFDSPINFIRVIADADTSWTLEVLT